MESPKYSFATNEGFEKETRAISRSGFTLYWTFVNQITARTRELKEFGNPSGGAIVFGVNFEESSAFLWEIKAYFEPRISENLISASLTLDGEERGITVRAVDIRDFIKTRDGQLEREIARKNHEADTANF